MNYTIREIDESEYRVLEDFLYEAIFIPKGVEAPPREIIYFIPHVEQNGLT